MQFIPGEPRQSRDTVHGLLRLGAEDKSGAAALGGCGVCKWGQSSAGAGAWLT